MNLLVTEIDPQLSSSTSTLDLLHLDLKKFRNFAMIFLVRETTGIVVWFITIKTRIKNYGRNTECTWCAQGGIGSVR